MAAHKNIAPRNTPKIHSFSFNFSEERVCVSGGGGERLHKVSKPNSLIGFLIRQLIIEIKMAGETEIQFPRAACDKKRFLVQNVNHEEENEIYAK